MSCWKTATFCSECHERNYVPVTTACGTVCNDCFHDLHRMCQKCKTPLCGHAPVYNIEALALYSLLEVLTHRKAEFSQGLSTRITAVTQFLAKYNASKQACSFGQLSSLRTANLALAHIAEAVQVISSSPVLANTLLPNLTIPVCFRSDDPVYTRLVSDPDAVKLVEKACNLKMTASEKKGVDEKNAKEAPQPKTGSSPVPFASPHPPPPRPLSGTRNSAQPPNSSMQT